jgi:hypothetical protein
MARIRSMKPELWGDEKLAPLAAIHRLVFLGLISQADDAGRLMDSVRYIDGLLFSRTDDSCAASLVVLHQLGVIERGSTASGQPVIQITKWSRHQKIERPNLKGALPPISTPIAQQPRQFTEASVIDRGGVGEESVSHSPMSRRTDLRSSIFDLRSSTYDLRPTTDDLPRAITESDDTCPDLNPEPIGRSVGRSDSPNGANPDGHGTATPTAAVVGQDRGNPLAAFSEVAGRLASLQHGCGYQAAAELVLERLLFPDDSPQDADLCVVGHPLAERERLVLKALGEYRLKHAGFDWRLFCGFVERLRGPKANGAHNGSGGLGIVKLHQPAPQEPYRERTPEELVQIARISAETRALMRSASISESPPADPEPMPAATIDDPDRVAARQGSRERQKSELEARRREGKPEPQPPEPTP